MEIIVWIVFGVVAGWIASLITDNNDPRTIFTEGLIGAIGALIGGFGMNALGQTSANGINTISLMVAALSAILVLITYRRIEQV